MDIEPFRHWQITGGKHSEISEEVTQCVMNIETLSKQSLSNSVMCDKPFNLQLWLTHEGVTVSILQMKTSNAMESYNDLKSIATVYRIVFRKGHEDLSVSDVFFDTVKTVEIELPLHSSILQAVSMRFMELPDLCSASLKYAFRSFEGKSSCRDKHPSFADSNGKVFSIDPIHSNFQSLTGLIIDDGSDVLKVRRLNTITGIESSLATTLENIMDPQSEDFSHKILGHHQQLINSLTNSKQSIELDNFQEASFTDLINPFHNPNDRSSSSFNSILNFSEQYSSRVKFRGLCLKTDSFSAVKEYAVQLKTQYEKLLICALKSNTALQHFYGLKMFAMVKEYLISSCVALLLQPLTGLSNDSVVNALNAMNLDCYSREALIQLLLNQIMRDLTASIHASNVKSSTASSNEKKKGFVPLQSFEWINGTVAANLFNSSAESQLIFYRLVIASIVANVATPENSLMSDKSMISFLRR